MEIINQDITIIKRGIIVHQVNNEGVMGGGVALTIRRKYPQHYIDYIHCFEVKNGKPIKNLELLGTCVTSVINDDLMIVGMFSQNGLTNICNTDYDAFKKCLMTVKDIADKTGLVPCLPYLIGCCRGGGNWSIISSLIEQILPQTILYKYPN